MSDELTSTRPYLLRAMHEWMTDNGQTPLVVVDIAVPDVNVPVGFATDGRIVLNIDWSATRNLQMTNDGVSFEARFGGVSHSVSFPIAAVQGVYARESGQGMLFQNDPALPGDVADASLTAAADTDGDDDRKPPRGPGLRLVK